MPAKPEPYIYGKSPAPSNWHETVQAMNSIKPKPKPKSNGLFERLDAIETLLKKK